MSRDMAKREELLLIVDYIDIEIDIYFIDH